MNLVNLNSFPLMGEALRTENMLPLDFTEANKALSEVDLSNTAEFNAFVFNQMRTANKKYGIGGYL